MNFIRLDKNYNIKSRDSNNNRCYSSFLFTSSGVYFVTTAQLLFVKRNNDYYLLRTYQSGGSYAFDLLKIIQTCQNIINATSINPNYEDTSETSSSTPKIPILQTSIIKAVTTIPTSLILPTSIIKKATKIPTTILSPTSIIKETTIKQTSIIKETTTLQTTLISPTSIIKETIKMPITSIRSTLISKVSSLKTTTISLPLSTKIKTTILNSLTTILQQENKSSTLSPSSTQIDQPFPKTTINKQFQSVLKSEFLKIYLEIY
jgi:hypothetical protein